MRFKRGSVCVQEIHAFLCLDCFLGMYVLFERSHVTRPRFTRNHLKAASFSKFVSHLTISLVDETGCSGNLELSKTILLALPICSIYVISNIL